MTLFWQWRLYVLVVENEMSLNAKIVVCSRAFYIIILSSWLSVIRWLFVLLLSVNYLLISFILLFFKFALSFSISLYLSLYCCVFIWYEKIIVFCFWVVVCGLIRWSVMIFLNFYQKGRMLECLLGLYELQIQLELLYYMLCTVCILELNRHRERLLKVSTKDI